MVSLSSVLSLSVLMSLYLLKVITRYFSLHTGNFLSVNFTEQQILTFFGIVYEIISFN
jgi:hypothetical protein